MTYHTDKAQDSGDRPALENETIARTARAIRNALRADDPKANHVDLGDDLARVMVDGYFNLEQLAAALIAFLDPEARHDGPQAVQRI